MQSIKKKKNKIQAGEVLEESIKSKEKESRENPKIEKKNSDKIAKKLDENIKGM